MNPELYNKSNWFGASVDSWSFSLENSSITSASWSSDIYTSKRLYDNFQITMQWKIGDASINQYYTFGSFSFRVQDSVNEYSISFINDNPLRVRFGLSGSFGYRVITNSGWGYSSIYNATSTEYYNVCIVGHQSGVYQ